MGMISVATLMAWMLNACSSGSGTGGYGSNGYGTSYANYNNFNSFGARPVYYGGYQRELPHSPGYSVTPPQQVVTNTQTNTQVTEPPQQAPAYKPTSSNKTKDPLGHKPGPKNFGTVIIDAGHGGKDSGALVNGVSEKKLALDIARKLKQKLDGTFKAVFIRNGDYYVSLDGRVNATHKFDDAVLVSIHLNHAKASYVRGPETYYFRVDSYSLAKRMQQAMAAVSPVEKSRGLVRRRLRLTRNPQIPSVLVEIGYLSNSSERTLLSQDSYRDKMATALANALKDQKRLGDKGMGKLPEPLNRPLSRPSDSSSL